MGVRDWIARSADSSSPAPRMSAAQQAKANQIGIVYPAPPSQGYVDLPVWSPMQSRYTTAWSGQVPVLDPGEQLDVYAASLRVGDPAAIYKSQPQVRKVVEFIVRAIASTPLKLYNRVSDDVRRPVEAPLSQLLRQPAPYVTPYRLWTGVLSDWLIFDRWALWKVPDDSPAGLRLVRIPARRFHFVGDELDQLTAIRVVVDRNTGEWRDMDPDQFIFDYGYVPDGMGGLTPMQTLAETLAESAESMRWRRQVWANGARMTGWIQRSLEAGELEGWGPVARDRFLAEFEAKFRGGGPGAGGVPMLEDGMTFNETKAFSSVDMADLEQRKLTAVEVASSFHIAPELVGAREGTYSNVREYRQALYRDNLGPYFTPIKQAVNRLLVDGISGRRRWYVDFDLDSKLRGSFEERAALTSTAVGAPWMTRNEARAIDNRPPIDGGDEIVTPLNVLVGSQPSPQTPTGDGGDDNEEPAETPPAPPAARGRVKQLLPDSSRDRLLFDYEAALRQFAQRQASSVMSALGAKSVPPLTDAWNKDRWDRELRVVIGQHLSRVGELRAALVAAQLDTLLDLGELSQILTERATGIAEGFNAKTFELLAQAILVAEWKQAVAAVFDKTAGARAGGLAMTTATEANGLSAVYAARPAGPVMKRWVVRSRNPRATHRAMSGETVDIDSTFSNGAEYPGAGTLPTAERARCTCDIELVRREDALL